MRNKVKPETMTMSFVKIVSFARQMPPQRNPLQLNGILRRTIQLRSYDFNSHGVEVIEHLDASFFKPSPLP